MQSEGSSQFKCEINSAMKNIRNTLLLLVASGAIAACNNRMTQSQSDALSANSSTKVSVAGDYYFKIQEYEGAVKKYNAVLERKGEKPADVHAAKLQLARLYYETKQFEKAESLYKDVIADGMLDGLTSMDVNNYLDLLRMSGSISQANVVVDKFNNLMSDTRFTNIKSAVKKYEGFLSIRLDTLGRYGLEDIGDRVESININLSGYQYGASVYKDGIVFMSNYVQTDKAKTLYTNSRMYFKNRKGITPFNKSLEYTIQSGPAAFYNNEQSVIYTTNRYGKVKTEKQLNTAVTNELQLVTSSYDPKSGKWSDPKRISNWAGGKSSAYSFMHPSLTPDGKRLYFASNMPGGYGGSDLYYADWDSKHNIWGAAVNLGPDINTNGNELFPQVFADGMFLFSSNGQEGYGRQDIYVTNLNKDKKEIVHLPYPINTQYDDVNPVFMPSTNMFYLTSDRPGFNGNDRLYILDMLKYPLVELGYKPREKKKDTTVTDVRGITDEMVEPKKEKQVLPTYLVHFEFNKDVLMPDDIRFLENILANYSAPKYIIRVDGYTDVLGTWKYNMSLSQRRAEAVKNYLLSRGIPASQIETNAFGPSNFKVVCDGYLNKDQCIKYMMQNRRCEITIFEKETSEQ